MPKVTLIKAARKDYPNFGIKKGDPYYSWSLMTGPASSTEYKSKTPPKRSQLTSSEFLSTLYGIEETMEALTSSYDSFEEDKQEIVFSLEELKDSTQEKLDNMPEGLQMGSTGELLQERIEALDSMISEIENVEIEELEENATEEEKEEALQTALEDLKQISSGL